MHPTYTVVLLIGQVVILPIFNQPAGYLVQPGGMPFPCSPSRLMTMARRTTSSWWHKEAKGRSFTEACPAPWMTKAELSAPDRNGWCSLAICSDARHSHLSGTHKMSRAPFFLFKLNVCICQL